MDVETDRDLGDALDGATSNRHLRRRISMCGRLHRDFGRNDIGAWKAGAARGPDKRWMGRGSTRNTKGWGLRLWTVGWTEQSRTVYKQARAYVEVPLDTHSLEISRGTWRLLGMEKKTTSQIRFDT